MATTTVNALTALASAASGDKIPIWDISAGQYKAITKANLVGGAMAGTSLTLSNTLASWSDLIVLQTADPSSVNFSIGINDTPVFNGVRDNQFWIGYNFSSSIDNSEPSVAWVIENHYQYDPSLSRTEIYLVTQPPSPYHTTAYDRAMQVNVEHNSNYQSLGIDVNLLTVTFRGATGLWGVGGGYVSQSGLTTRVDPNDRWIIEQANAAGTGFKNIIKLNSSDRVSVGDSTTGIYIAGDSEFRKLLWVGTTGNPDEMSTRLAFSLAGYSTYQQWIRSMSSAGTVANNVIAFEMSDATANGHNEVFRVQGDKRVGINDSSPDATLDIVTADAAAVPVLLLEQLDVSEEMIEFVSTAGAGNAIEAVGGKSLTTTHWIKVTINGDVRYLPAGTIS